MVEQYLGADANNRRRLTPNQRVNRLIATLDPERAAEMGVVTGRQALEWLSTGDRAGKYVFHGSNNKLELLEPRQQMQYDGQTGVNTPDGEPAVCATDLVDTAIFMGVTKGQGGSEQGSHHGWDGHGGDMRFYATKDILDAARDSRAPGYVHVFSKTDFRPYHGNEYRAAHEVEPVYTVPVVFADLPPNVKIVAPGPAES